MLTGAVPWPAEFASRYRRDGYWSGETLADLALEPARRDGARTAVVTATERLSYAELDTAADRLASGLATLGVRRGDRLVVQLPNTSAFVETCLALFRLGAIPVLAPTALRRAEMEYLCELSEAVAVVVPDVYVGFDHRAMVREIRGRVRSLREVLVAGEPGEFHALKDVTADPVELPPPVPGEVALLLLSGGTTGMSKLIPRTHDDYAYQIRATATEMGFDADGTYLACLPAAHNAALGCPGILGALRVGAKVVLAGSPSPDAVFPLVAREGATLTTLIPNFLPLWLDSAELFDVDLSTLVIEVGGAMLTPEVARRVEPTLGCTLTRWFGMAEGLLSFTRPGDTPERRYTTEGRPLCPADELRVVDENGRDVAPGCVGELLTRGPYTIRGYYRAPEYNARTFTPDGFYRTGDLVRISSDGTMVVDGRIKDVINHGGEKVSALEVEEQLRACPGVVDAAVIAVSDGALDERICACVVATDPPPTLAQVREFLVARGLARYKLPDRLELVAELPYTPVGKVHKAALRAAVAGA